MTRQQRRKANRHESPWDNILSHAQAAEALTARQEARLVELTAHVVTDKSPETVGKPRPESRGRRNALALMAAITLGGV